MVFQREMIFGEIVKEATEVFKDRFYVIVAVTLLNFIIGIFPEIYKHYLKPGGNVAPIYDSAMSSNVVPQAASFMEIASSITVMAGSIVIGAVYIMKILQYYFDDSKTTTEQIKYVIPRVFRWFFCNFLIWIVITIPCTILMVVMALALMNLGKEIVTYVMMGTIVLLMLPWYIVMMFMEYKILIDDSKMFTTIKESFRMVFKNLIKFIPLWLISGVMIGLTIGLQVGVMKILGLSFWVYHIFSYFLAFGWAFVGLLMLVQYLNLDFIENRESYQIIEEF